MNIGVFTVKSMYKVLQPCIVEAFSWQMVWRSCVQLKICFFSWEAAWGRILTLDMLQRRGVPLVNRWFLCQQCEESTNHFLLLFLALHGSCRAPFGKCFWTGKALLLARE